MKGIIDWPPSPAILLYVPALFVGFTVHELAHALVAYLLGDTSQVERKRLSFNPLRHVSWVGMVIFMLFGFGWAKPVWVDASRFRLRNRALGMFLVSIAGVTANLLLVLLASVAFAGTMVIASAVTGASMWEAYEFLTVAQPALDLQGLAVALSSYMLYVNLVLALFNLVPIPPLDGFQALVSLIAAVRTALRPADREQPRPASPAAGQEEVRSPAQIHFDIGLAYQKAGQLDEAIARYRQALAQDDQFALAYYNLGLVYQVKGRLALAAGAFRSAKQFGRDVAVRLQADLRLRGLAQAEQNAEGEPRPAPAPLEPDSVAEAGIYEGAAALDPAVARRVWIRLALGGAAMFATGGVIWTLVTLLVVMSLA
jgi:Zn-dependent protease